MKKIGIVSLGCPKNQVDTERIIAKLYRDDEEMEVDLFSGKAKVDSVVINTCSFIKDAIDESMQEINKLLELKKQDFIKELVITGCLVSRWGKNKLLKEISRMNPGSSLEDYNIFKYDARDLSERRKIESGHSAYLKIAEGCDRKCSFCMIPEIRGHTVCFDKDALVREAFELAESGSKELILVAEDVCEYKDKYGNDLIDLLRDLVKLERVKWIRLLYMNPDGLSHELIDYIIENDKICSYFDMPFQHIDDGILNRMGRNGNGKKYRNLVNYIRKRDPQSFIRGTFIVGFPGEDEKCFNNLIQFLNKGDIDRVVVFKYSDEKGTAAYKLDNKVNEEIKIDREKEINQIAEWLWKESALKMIDRSEEVLIERYCEEDNHYYARSRYESPEIDSIHIIDTNSTQIEGEIIMSKNVDFFDNYFIGVPE